MRLAISGKLPAGFGGCSSSGSHGEHYTGAPLKDESGRIVGGLEYMTDISELKKTELSIQKTNGFLQGQILEATGQLTAASAEILAATSEQAASISEQASAVKQTSSTVDQVRQTALQSSERAEKVAEMMRASSILSLNAAMEAARAGESGKSFAVVAGEVRKLAEQSRQATTKVREILGQIRKAANIAVIVTES